MQILTEAYKELHELSPCQLSGWLPAFSSYFAAVPQVFHLWTPPNSSHLGICFVIPSTKNLSLLLSLIRDSFSSFRSGSPGRYCPWLPCLKSVTPPAIPLTSFTAHITTYTSILGLVTCYFLFPRLCISSIGGKNNVYVVHKTAELLVYATYLMNKTRVEDGRKDEEPKLWE